MPSLGSRAALLAASAALLAGCSTSYHAGDKAARDWDAWVEDHPLAGARVTDAVGTNVQPFEGSFEAYARLTAPANRTNIVKAMASMCRFNSETSSTTTYWLQVDAILLQAPCQKSDQLAVATFWQQVGDLTPKLVEVALSTKGLSVSADDEDIIALEPELAHLADKSGWPTRSATYTFTSPHITLTQKPGASLAEELNATRDLVALAGAATRKVEIVAGRVSAATTGSVAQADDWQGRVGSPVLTVTPRKVTTELPFADDARDLIDQLADDPRVLGINVVKAFWEITTASTKDARGLATDLAHEPATKDLGRLQLDVGPSSYVSATGKGRTCFVRPDFTHPAHAAALLDLCDLPEAVEVDDRFDAALDLRLHSSDLAPALACLKRAPYGLPVYLQLPQNDTVEFTTGETLQLKFPEAASSKKLEALWESLPAR